MNHDNEYFAPNLGGPPKDLSQSQIGELVKNLRSAKRNMAASAADTPGLMGSVALRE